MPAQKLPIAGTLRSNWATSIFICSLATFLTGNTSWTSRYTGTRPQVRWPHRISTSAITLKPANTGCHVNKTRQRVLIFSS